MKYRYIVLAILVLVGVFFANSAIHAHRRQYGSPKSPRDVCMHVRMLLYEQAQLKDWRSDAVGDTQATIDTIEQVNVFSVDACTRTLQSMWDEAPLHYAIRARCLLDARDTHTAAGCVR